MDFTNLDLKDEYRSFQDNITEDFYIPVLKQSKMYKRAVGYFSSTALLQIVSGIKGLISNNGKIQLIASPQLSEKDIEAIQKGYETREQVVEDAILRSIDFQFSSTLDKKKMNILSYLIAEGILDIKIAFIEMNNQIGIYHEKLGIMEDNEGNKVVFTGSMNETGMALSYNYEAFDVYCSWTGDQRRVESKERSFDGLWNNEICQVNVYNFPEIAIEKFKGFIFEEPDWTFTEDRSDEEDNREESEIIFKKAKPAIPKTFNLRDYQEEAIVAWKSNAYRGIFDMATGTGKTYTGLAAAVTLFEDAGRLAIIIVCPYQHLVEQWVEDIEFFGMKPIIGYSASKQKDWKNKLSEEVEYFNFSITDHFCFVTTNASFSTPFVQNELRKIRGNTLLLIDEAHNFGAEHLQTKLLPNVKYRLALSATINRHRDEDGTAALFAYFGDICMSYTLEMAIDSGKLTPYYYHPVIVTMTESELEKYKELTLKIIKNSKKDKNGKLKFNESAKYFLIERARVVASAVNKLSALRDAMKDYAHESNILVYCGAATINDPEYVEGRAFEEEKRQIDIVTHMLGNEMDMRVSKFTSEESISERGVIKANFADGRKLQALIAIRCLDEGVDIPSVKTAFILASSTNPKEYIQRRGRVLRLSKGKKNAVIYDFITLPYEVDEMYAMDFEDIRSYKGLIQRELDRMQDFAQLAENSSVADQIISELKEIFNLYGNIDEVEGSI